jgi:hypothetical protein
MKYIHALPEKAKKRAFIAACLGTNNPNTPEALFECVKEIEIKHSQKTSAKLIRKILKPVVSELQPFYNIIDTMGMLYVYLFRSCFSSSNLLSVQVNPTPAAIIWGGLKIIINVRSRRLQLSLFELN